MSSQCTVMLTCCCLLQFSLYFRDTGWGGLSSRFHPITPRQWPESPRGNSNYSLTSFVGTPSTTAALTCDHPCPQSAA